MTPGTFSERRNLAQKLLSIKENVAQAMTSEFFTIHPEWEARYGERGRQCCTADARFHMEFLAAAIEADSPQAFGDYARWTARMLGARGIGAHTLEENLTQLETHILPALLPGERDAVSAFLCEGRQACTVPQPASATQSSDGPLGLTMRAFLTAILGGQRRTALGVIEEALSSGARQVDIYVDVIAEALHNVGALWEQNKISVAQEHMASVISQYVIAMIYPRIVPLDKSLGKMVVTGVSGEQHQIGANLVADAMEENGWEVRFLGTNLPHASVLSTIDETSADVLCISTTLVANLPSAVELVRSVRERFGARVPRIVLGGSAFQLVPQFAKEIGSSEVIPDLRQAIDALCP
jgi:methanogenic corrinoid protein MtbC1